MCPIAYGRREIRPSRCRSIRFYSCLRCGATFGQSRLHVEVWDYQLLETLIGETIIDLEDRLFSKEWQAMQGGSLRRSGR